MPNPKQTQKQRLTILIDENEHQALKILAAETGQSMTDLASKWIKTGISKAQTKIQKTKSSKNQRIRI